MIRNYLMIAQSESVDTETERLKEEERKKEEEKKAALPDQEKGKSTIAPHSSGTSAKSSKAPSNGLGKQADRKKASSNALKRSGSPNLSEASGVETPRKKHKKKQPAPSQMQSINPITKPTSPPTSKPASPPPSQPSSSAPISEPIRSTLANSHNPSGAALAADALKPPKSRPEGKRPRSHAGSGSERDTAGSGGEGSDGTRKKLMLKFSKAGSKGSTPHASRAGSPDSRSGDTAGKGHSLLGTALVGNASIGNAPVGNGLTGNAPAGLSTPNGK